jgi:PAS domain S-box-containing protein
LVLKDNPAKGGLPVPARRRGDADGSGFFDLIQAGLDHIDQGITIFDAKLELVAWNRMFFQLLDFPERLARRGTPFSAFMRHNAERGEYGAGDVDTLVAQRVETARRFLPHTLERVRPNGRIIAVRGEPLPGGSGFVTVYSDVTEQRQEERRILAEKVGLESRLRLITDTVPALIAYIDREERYQFVNRGYADWVGRRKEGVLGRKVRTILGPRVYDAIKPHIDAAFRGERATYEYSAERGGRTVHARSTLVPERLDDGSIAGLFVLSSDVTEQKAAEAALVQAQKMQAIGQLTGGLAHDFNNLLTIVIGNLATLAERQDGESTAFVEPALAAARRGADLTRRLLAFARRQPLTPQPTEINGLIASMVGLLDRSLSRNVEIALTHRAGTAYALVDPHQMENALINLALNARDAMPEGGRLSIATSLVDAAALDGFDDAVAPGAYVRVEVADTGAGMDAETLSRAFEPFFTRKRPGTGSGLGLPMVYGFVKQSGGHIRLSSKLGAGTTVTLLLPRAPEPPAVATPSVGTPAIAAAPPAHQRLVLVVEDEPEVRALIRRQLADAGHAVLVAASGAEALELIETVEDLDVLVTDVVMPGRPDGLSLAAIARRRRPDLRIVVVTGHAERLAAPGRKAAALPYPVLMKPFTAAELAAAVAADGPLRR